MMILLAKSIPSDQIVIRAMRVLVVMILDCHCCADVNALVPAICRLTS